MKQKSGSNDFCFIGAVNPDQAPDQGPGSTGIHWGRESRGMKQVWGSRLSPHRSLAGFVQSATFSFV